MSKLEPGCWIDTCYGHACLTDIRYCPHTKKEWAQFRYGAVRFDGAHIWVANSVPLADVEFVGPPNRQSARVLRLRGPYGLESVQPRLIAKAREGLLVIKCGGGFVGSALWRFSADRGWGDSPFTRDSLDMTSLRLVRRGTS